MLNWPLLKNPLNWVIVWIILLLGAALFHVIGQHVALAQGSAANQ